MTAHRNVSKSYFRNSASTIVLTSYGRAGEHLEDLWEQNVALTY